MDSKQSEPADRKRRVRTIRKLEPFVVGEVEVVVTEIRGNKITVAVLAPPEVPVVFSDETGKERLTTTPT